MEESLQKPGNWMERLRPSSKNAIIHKIHRKLTKPEECNTEASNREVELYANVDIEVGETDKKSETDFNFNPSIDMGIGFVRGLNPCPDLDIDLDKSVSSRPPQRIEEPCSSNKQKSSNFSFLDYSILERECTDNISVISDNFEEIHTIIGKYPNYLLFYRRKLQKCFV